MSRRVSLPGADELFRTTGGTALQASTPRRQTNGEPRVPPPAGEGGAAAAKDGRPRDGARTTADPERADRADGARSTARSGTGAAEYTAADADQGPGAPRRRVPGGPGGQARSAPATVARKRGRTAARRPSGRERHDEKITVYVSAEELMDLEHARLVLRGEHGLAVDRGRIVREAVAVVLADLESRGDASILVRRLRGR